MSPVTTRTRAGLVLAALLGVGDLVALFFPTPEGEMGPPYSILLLGAVLGLATLAGVAAAWRTGRRGALRLVAGTRVLSAIAALPAFFVDEVPAVLKLLAAVAVVLTVVCVVLVLAPARRPTGVTD
jgi:peptidoglycan/LPS O-acetylase OafA/YrhL